MHAETDYSNESLAPNNAPEWSSEPNPMKLADDQFYDGENFEYIQPRQTEYDIIRPE